MVPFYEAVLGYTTKSMPMPDGSYVVLERDGRSCGGIMRSPSPKQPAAWLPYIIVDDCDAAVGRAQRHGGRLEVPAHSVEGVGRFATVADDRGARVGLITPASG